MTEVDIFASTTPLKGEFFAFRDIGDSVQGTYIDMREGVDSFGNDQFIYVLHDKKANKIWNIGVRKTILPMVERMENIRFGQIVGFKLDERKESKKHPGQKFNIVNIYAEPTLVDQEWLDNRKMIESQFSPVNRTTSPSVNPPVPANVQSDAGWDIGVPFTAPTNIEAAKANLPSAPAKPENAVLETIRTLAKTKGLTDDSMPPEEQDHVIQQFTGFTLEEENLTKIIIALTGYSKS